MKTACKILKWLIILTAVWMVLYIIGGVINSLTTFTSFPWYSAFVFAAIYFGPALVLEAIAYVVLKMLQKKK